ncbi:MAG TPA: hypothetical protein VMT24_19810, partial [Aggregatilineaceae bacterium]|nr:hypothetical protein [Aggregatilineaceae bacterium]
KLCSDQYMRFSMLRAPNNIQRTTGKTMPCAEAQGGKHWRNSARKGVVLVKLIFEIHPYPTPKSCVWGVTLFMKKADSCHTSNKCRIQTP